jgi:hypothetical protein
MYIPHRLLCQWVLRVHGQDTEKKIKSGYQNTANLKHVQFCITTFNNVLLNYNEPFVQ